MENPENNNEKSTIYEAGLLIDPALSDEEAVSAVAEVKALFEQNGGVFVSEAQPTKRVLAYTITTSRDGKKAHFDQAYFAWVKYEVSPESIEAIQGAIDSQDAVVRSLVIKAPREDFAPFKPMKRTVSSDKAPEGDSSEPISISKEELDKTIEELVIE